MILAIATAALLGQCQPGRCAVRPAAPAYRVSAPAYASPQSDPSPGFLPAPRTPAVVPVPMPPPAPFRPAPAPVQGGDPYGFLGWLNATRAAHGAPPVVLDGRLTADCVHNNRIQAAHGSGHHHMGGRRQNVAMTDGGIRAVEQMWMDSPVGHKQALLDPSVRRVGIANNGRYWTYEAD